MSGRAAASLCLTTLLAQAQPPQFKSGVDVVRFDVVVLDKARHPVAGLTEQDFRITEDGKPLRIAGFEAVTIPVAAPPPPMTTAPGAVDLHVESVTNHRDVPGRLVVIVMDRSIPYEQGIVTARKIANAAIDALGPNDLAAVVFTSGISGNRLQDLTANRDRLRAAVASAQMGTPTNVEMTPNGLKRTGRNLPPGETPCGLATMETLAGVAEAIGPVQDYRKMILFIGTDLPFAEDSAAGREPDCQGLFGSTQERLSRAIDQGSLTVHAFDPRGLTTGALGADAFRSDAPESASDRMIREGNLRRLPDYTGGRTIVNVNQPEQFVSPIFEESRTYYVLAVERAPARRNTKSHTVRIEVDRRDTAVVSRTTYVDAVADASKKSSDDPLKRALGELLPRNDVSLRMTLEPGETRDSSLKVTLATPLSAPVRADVLVGVFDEFGKPVGSERAKVDLPARDGGNVEWKMHLNPKPGHYEVRAAVGIGTAVGTIAGYVDVPAKERSHTKADAGTTPAPRVRVEPSAETAALLQRAAAYLEQYSDPANGLVLEERYTQEVNVRPPRIRDLRSELLILPDATEGWLQYRDVMNVDGKAVADRTDRLMRLFASPAADARDQARRIADEGARYNISGAVTVSRTLNQPLAALLFLRGAAQPRSEFQPQGTAGSGGQHVSFVEIAKPSLIGVSGGEPATGQFWIDPPSGRILRSELHVVSRSNTGTASATIRVQYAYDAKTQRMLPTVMQEHYLIQDARGLVQTIDGEAKYSNPRQFKVTTEAK
jgi:VWFA-related protein